MSAENDKESAMEQAQRDAEQRGILVSYDDGNRPTVMYISIPLKTLAANGLGTAVLRGSLEEIKIQALANIKQIRDGAKSGIIKPRMH